MEIHHDGSDVKVRTLPVARRRDLDAGPIAR